MKALMSDRSLDHADAVDSNRLPSSLAQFDERIQYVEGHALGQSNILIDHAWNSYGDFHFDLTSELAFKTYFSGYLAANIFD